MIATGFLLLVLCAFWVAAIDVYRIDVSKWRAVDKLVEVAFVAGVWLIAGGVAVLLWRYLP